MGQKSVWYRPNLIAIIVAVTAAVAPAVGCTKIQKLAAKTPGLPNNAELALDETPYCPGFLPETDTSARETPPMVPTGVAVGQYCRENSLTPGSVVAIKDGPGKRREFCPCPANRCDAFGHPALLGAFDPDRKKITTAAVSARTGTEECGWPSSKMRLREAYASIPGNIADGPGKEGHACQLLAYVPACAEAGSCCDGGRLTGRPLAAQRIADGKDPQVNFKVCNELATARRPLKASLCELPLQGACSAGIWDPVGKEMGKSHADQHGPASGHGACWAADQNNADGIVQAHCHDGGELVRTTPGHPGLAGHRECHMVRKGPTRGQLDVFTFVVDCSADGGNSVASRRERPVREAQALSAKLLTTEELEADSIHHTTLQDHHGKAKPGHVPKIVDESEW